MVYHFEIWRGHCPLAPRFERLKIFIWGWPNLRSYFSPFVNQPTFTKLIGVYGNVCRLQRRFPIDDILFQSGDIRDQVAKLSEIALKL